MHVKDRQPQGMSSPKGSCFGTMARAMTILLNSSVFRDVIT